ncbi:MAG: extracellular solute-binding protein [Chloroflexota bacterium]
MKHTRMSLLAVMLLVALAVAACAPGGGGDTSAADMDAGMDGGVSVTAPGTFPIVEEKVSLRVLMVQHPLVEDFETNEFTKWYEEKTNVHIDWELVPSSGATEKLNLVLASGDLPDVIMDFTVSPAQQTIYGTQGLFLPLNDLIEEYGVETKKMFDASPNVNHLCLLCAGCT